MELGEDADLLVPAGAAVGRIAARVDRRVESDTDTAERLSGLIGELGEIDPFWSGPWRYRHTSPEGEETVIRLGSTSAELVDLFVRTRRLQGLPSTPVVPIFIALRNRYGAGVDPSPLTTAAGTPPAVMPRFALTYVRLWMTQKEDELAAGGVVTRATSGRVGVEIFDAMLRWLEPDSFHYETRRMFEIDSALHRRIYPIESAFRTRNASLAEKKIPRHNTGWLNLYRPSVVIDRGLLPESAVVSTDPSTGGTIVRLGDSPWTVRDEDVFALRDALGIPRVEQIPDVSGLSRQQIRELDLPFW